MERLKKRQLAVKAVTAAFNACAAVGAVLLYFLYPESFEILKGFEFFSCLSPLHLYWAVWLTGIILQFFPTSPSLPAGAEKQFIKYYVPSGKEPAGDGFGRFKKRSRREARLMGLVWGVCVAAAGALAYFKIFDYKLLFLLCTVLYVSDNFCLTVGCPFRIFIMKNRCCKTCRIHNWDRLMTLSPLFFVPGFFSLSLILPAFALLVVWEICFAKHPERFWEGTNCALMCKYCTDKLCKNNKN